MSVLVMSGKFFKIADEQALQTERSIIYYETFTKIASKRFMPKGNGYLNNRAIQDIIKISDVYLQAIDMPEFMRLGIYDSHLPLLIYFQSFNSTSRLLTTTKDSLAINSTSRSSTAKDSLAISWCSIKVNDRTYDHDFKILSFKYFFIKKPKNAYLKPVYTRRYKHSSDRGSGWDKGNLLPFSQNIFEELIREKKNGNVSRIYFVIQ
jgi:hypothetical protein